MRIGKMLKMWRAVHDISVRDMAKDIGISAATLCRVEQGHDMHSSVLFKVLAWLGEQPPKEGGKK